MHTQASHSHTQTHAPPSTHSVTDLVCTTGPPPNPADAWPQGKVLGGDDFLDIFVFVVCKSSVPKLAILCELMSRFPGTSEEEYLCTTTVRNPTPHELCRMGKAGHNGQED